MVLNKYSSSSWQLRAWDYLSQDRSVELAVLSPDLIVLEVSEKFREFQCDPELAPVGKLISELVWELVGSENALQEIIHGGTETFRLDKVNRVVLSDSIKYLSIKAIPLSRDEPGKGLLLIVEDTTYTSGLEHELVQERNELRLTKSNLSLANEELRKLNRLKSIFLSIAAHDLRSPLTAIRGYTDLALNILSDEASEVKGFLSTVISLTDTLNRLISDFLDLDTIEQGNLKIRPKACDLKILVLEVSDAMSAIANRKKISIDTQAKDNLPAVYADPDRIRQVLFNLIGNAIKYTNEGDQIQIETGRKDDYVYFKVVDHGPGVPESEIPRLFELYHRTEDARKSMTKGLGLGLFIVKAIVDLHHGQIFVRSESGQGTEFSVQLPVYHAGTEAKL